MEEIAKHINDTNASYRHIGAGDAKNTDLFLDNEHYELFQDCGEQITVRFDKTNLTQAILFIASILPRKFDQSANHYIVNYSDGFVFDQLAILGKWCFSKYIYPKMECQKRCTKKEWRNRQSFLLQQSTQGS